MTSKSLSAGFALTAALLASVAQAADTTVVGTIQTMQSLGSLAAAPGNADLRIYLNGVSTVCPGASDATWGYINANDGNFKGVLATISMAYAMGKPITMVKRPSPIGSGTYCQIVMVFL